MATEQHTQPIGDSAAMADHDHDLIHDLSKRTDAQPSPKREKEYDETHG